MFDTVLNVPLASTLQYIEKISNESSLWDMCDKVFKSIQEPAYVDHIPWSTLQYFVPYNVSQIFFVIIFNFFACGSKTLERG